jgi:hypothetical protein
MARAPFVDEEETGPLAQLAWFGEIEIQLGGSPALFQRDQCRVQFRE